MASCACTRWAGARSPTPPSRPARPPSARPGPQGVALSHPHPPPPPLGHRLPADGRLVGALCRHPQALPAPPQHTQVAPPPRPHHTPLPSPMPDRFCCVQAQGVQFVIEPHLRFQGAPGEQVRPSPRANRQ